MRYLPFLQSAIIELGLLKLEFDTAIAIMMESCEGQHPRAISTEYRRIGEQLSDQEKRALGLRKNMFFSREAFESLRPIPSAAASGSLSARWPRRGSRTRRGSHSRRSARWTEAPAVLPAR